MDDPYPHKSAQSKNPAYRDKCEKLKMHLRTFIAHLSARPAMYVGKAKLDLVLTYIRGYSVGVCDTVGRHSSFGGWPLLDNFLSWISHKYQVDHPAWGTGKILYHFHDHNELKAIQAIGKLFHEFLDGPVEKKWFAWFSEEDYSEFSELQRAAEKGELKLRDLTDEELKLHETLFRYRPSKPEAPICEKCEAFDGLV